MNHLCKILSKFWILYGMIEKENDVYNLKISLLQFFFILKDPCSRKLISRNFRKFVTSESLSREIVRMLSFVRVYPKNFANFFARESSSE